jgi:hypothetical protein
MKRKTIISSILIVIFLIIVPSISAVQYVSSFNDYFLELSESKKTIDYRNEKILSEEAIFTVFPVLSTILTIIMVKIISFIFKFIGLVFTFSMIASIVGTILRIIEWDE